jgi:hypothetical protein
MEEVLNILDNLITVIYVLSVVVVTGIVLIKFKLTQSFSRILALYVIVSCLVEFFMDTTAFLKINNLFMISVFTPIEQTAWILFYFKFFSDNQKKYKLMLLLIPIFILLTYFENKNLNGLMQISFSPTLGAIVISTLSLIAFRFMLQKESFKDFYTIPFFYFNTAALIFFMGNLFYFATSSYIPDVEPRYWNLSIIIYNFIQIIFNGILFLGFLKIRE